MIEGLEFGSVLLRGIDDGLELFRVHGIRDGRGARVSLRIQLMQPVLDILQTLRPIRVAIGKYHAAAFFRKGVLSMSGNFVPGCFRKKKSCLWVHLHESAALFDIMCRAQGLSARPARFSTTFLSARSGAS